jgi:predicted Zn-dependent protease
LTRDRLFAQVGQRQDASYEFHVADDPEPNAFALPGGFVYVTISLPGGLFLIRVKPDAMAFKGPVHR